MNKARIGALLAALLLTTAVWAGETGIPNRLATAKIGEWATYRLPNGYLQKLTVIKRDGEGPEAMVTVRVENIYDNEVVNTIEFARDAGNPMEPPRVEDDPAVSWEITTRNVTVNGKAIVATVVEIEYEYDDDDIDDEEVEWYMSADIPVFGLIKKVDDDDVTFELVEYGEN